MAREYCSKCEENIQLKKIIFPKDEDLCSNCRAGVRYYYLIIGTVLALIAVIALFNPFYRFDQTDGFPASLNPLEFFLYVMNHDSTTPREMLMAFYPLFSLMVAGGVATLAIVRYFRFAYMSRMMSALTTATFLAVFSVGAIWESFEYGLWLRIHNEFHRELAESILNSSTKTTSYYLIVAIWILLFIYGIITIIVDSAENGKIREQKIKVNTINKSSFKNTPSYIIDKKRDTILKHVRENLILDVIADAELENKKKRELEAAIQATNAEIKAQEKNASKKATAKKPAAKKATTTKKAPVKKATKK